MNTLKFITALILTLLTTLNLHSISVVYNFRIAQITRQPVTEFIHKHPRIGTLLPFAFFQKSNCLDLKERYIGGLGMYHRYFKENYYFKADFAVAQAHQKLKDVTTVDVSESDDILFSIGRNLIKNKKNRVSFSGLLGIPTHSVYTLERIGLGTGQVGTGVQLDGLSGLHKNLDVLWGTRYVYFIPRTALNAENISYKFTLGSISDILVALQGKINFKHGIEGGYAARWGFGIKATPCIPNLDDANYMRNSFYLIYKYTFLTKKSAQRLLFNISYGFNSKPKNFDLKGIMVWGAWSIAF